MVDYVWAQSARLLGADRVAGTDADEIEALPSRAIQRYLRRGIVAFKQGGAGGTAGVSSVNTRTGAVMLAATDVGLGSVNNTADSAKPVSTAQQAAIDATALLPVNLQTASYTLVLADQGKVVEMNVGAANALTVPSNSGVAFPVGTILEVFQYGAGQTTITAGVGVTLRSSGAKLKLSGQYASASLRKRAADEWVAAGDLVV